MHFNVKFFVFATVLLTTVIIASYQNFYSNLGTLIKINDYLPIVFYAKEDAIEDLDNSTKVIFNTAQTTVFVKSTKSVVESAEELIKSKHRYVMINFYNGGLGNLMFQYSAMRSVAEKNGAYAIVPFSSPLRSVFTITAQVVNDSVYHSLLNTYRNKTRGARMCCAYEERLIKNMFSRPEQQFELLGGYMQSFRYFKEYENLIRKEFTFLPGFIKQAENHLRNISTQHSLALKKNISNIVFVGIHVRHGDIVSVKSQVDHGHKAASKEYIYKALSYFRNKYKNPAFVVASDDFNWTRAVLQQRQLGDIYYLPVEAREIDMATLTLCNHTIATTGTFSWWIGFLTNGETTYYKDWPRANSTLEKLVNKSDFFPKRWIGMA